MISGVNDNSKQVFCGFHLRKTYKLTSSWKYKWKNCYWIISETYY